MSAFFDGLEIVHLLGKTVLLSNREVVKLVDWVYLTPEGFIMVDEKKRLVFNSNEKALYMIRVI